MTEVEFIKITRDIEKYYDEEYNAEQRKYIFDTFKTMDKERFAILMQKTIKTCKYLPKLANLLELEQELPREKIPEKTKVDCKVCNGTGLVAYTKKMKNGDIEIPYQYVARCVCKNAEDISKAIPSVTEIGLFRN